MIYNKADLEQLEDKRLAPYAVRSKDSKGRKFDEGKFRGPGKGSARLCFQKDRDRIIHSKAFRRLDEKTQVFPAFFGDHYRTRLTHTLEVAQISRDICRRMGLNEDLAETIALAHDLGHPPFGHAGEDALDEALKAVGADGFEHNQQSKRVVEKLEKLYPNFDGLNLSIEVLEGLEKHKTSWDQEGVEFADMHFEGQVVNLADEIAYTNHDMDDGLRSGILKLDDLEGAALWKEAKSDVLLRYGEGLEDEVFISRMVSQIIYLMIDDIVAVFDEMKVQFSGEMSVKVSELREILFEKFYLSDEVKGRLDQGRDMIGTLFSYYMSNPEEVPAKYREEERLEIAIKDYIAGMTDRFLEKEVKKYANISAP
jgi:dGTPase